MSRKRMLQVEMESEPLTVSEDIPKLKAKDLMSGMKIKIFTKKQKVMDTGIVSKIDAVGIVWIINGDGVEIGYDLGEFSGIYANDYLGKLEASVPVESTKARQRRIRREEQRKVRKLQPKKVSQGVEKKLDLEKMEITINGTRNFNSGTFEIAWPDCLGKTRKEATYEMKGLQPPEGMRLCVASWNKGEGHFVIVIPEIKENPVIEKEQENETEQQDNT